MNNPNRKLFEVLVRESEGGLLTYLRSMVRDPGLVDDLFQETLITAWQKFDQFDESRPLAPWVRGIAFNLTRNALRSGYREKIFFSDKLASLVELSIREVETSEGDSWLERAEALRGCLGKLPQPSRDMIGMRYEQGLSANKIAIAKQKTSASVRKQLQRIREMLAVCIKQSIAQGAGS